MGSHFGQQFCVSTWGESHGGAVGVVVEGCPPRLPLTEQDIQGELNRRRPGQSTLTTSRQEPDRIRIVAGVYEGLTLGTPIAMTVANRDARPDAYAELRDKFRPSHADYTYAKKYGHRNPEGGGRSSARETLARVAAGAVARRILSLGTAIEIRAYVEQVHDIIMPVWSEFPSLQQVEQTAVRCPDPQTAAAMIERITQVHRAGDSVGGVILCRVRQVPVGLGMPVFDRLEADLAKAMLSIPATKGFEIGSGFSGTKLFGSEHNDAFTYHEGVVRTKTNRSGGVQGGISNGEEIYFRVAFKPTATIMKRQETVDAQGSIIELSGRGRHDPCVLPRAVPIVEAMAALVLVDHWMRHQGQCTSFDFQQTKVGAH